MKIMKLILPALILILSTTTFAQQKGSVSGIVKIPDTTPGVGATVSLIRLKDSATLKLAVANKEGSFSFERIAFGKYSVAATATGYRRNMSQQFELNAAQESIQLPVISLAPLGKEMASVTVTTKRPLIEQRADRVIVNVDASITNVGASAMEVLEKSPGVSVDREGNISLKGKEGVLILIDGRPTQLAAADLANMLRGMNSSQLDQVEIMTNPPARYEAQGNAGVINIKTKKTITAGYNGTLALGYAQGRYPKTNEGLNFNYRNKKWNFFTNLSHTYRKGFETLGMQRNIRDNSNNIENFFDQQAYKTIEGNSYNGRLGVDFFATEKTTFGVSVNAVSNKFGMLNQNTNNIFSSSKEIQDITTSEVDNLNRMKNFSANLNFRSVLNKSGREVTADFDHVTVRIYAKPIPRECLSIYNRSCPATGYAARLSAAGYHRLQRTSRLPASPEKRCTF